MTVLVWSAAALVTGFILDRCFGDPEGFPHIIRLIGALIAGLEGLLRRLLPATEHGERVGGVLLVVLVALVCTAVPLLVLAVGYAIFAPAGYAIESFLCYQLLAAKTLKLESMKVCRSLQADDIEGARAHVSMIVGRDTAVLDRAGITRAAVETVAENASDGVGAPLLFIMVGGAAVGCLYKAVNTMDSMVGYKNEAYLNFGRAAALTDDVFNFLPSRLSALLMVAAAYLVRLDGKRAFVVWKRDRRNHESPNSAQTESACAGALGVRLAGPATYGGVIHEKPFIGDDLRPIRDADIVDANQLMYASSALALVLAILFRAVCLGVVLLATL